jgi:hypothetical protein
MDKVDECMKVVVVCHNLVFKLVDGRTFSLTSLKSQDEIFQCW